MKLGTNKSGVVSRLTQEIYTYCAFWIAFSALPALAISYVVVRISKHLWLKLLSSRYPNLEFIQTDTVRSLLDTHRNQGIINVLLKLKGKLDVHQIKLQLSQHVIKRRDKNGELMFPRLRHLLVSCWGNYAWKTDTTFQAENHFTVANGLHRGRTVSDNNIQEFVSDIISKYFPSDQPPWQYIIIPCTSSEPIFYILVRVHHMLLSGKNSINIGDLLMIEQQKTIVKDETLSEASNESPLAKLYPMPSAIPQLWEKLNENMSNAWNEFVSEYDPVESPRALKTLPGVFHVAGLVLISSVSVLRAVTQKRTNGSAIAEGSITTSALVSAMRREFKRRNLTVPKMVISPIITVDPRKWPRRLFRTIFSTTYSMVKLPVRILDEMKALKELRNTGRTTLPYTMTWKYAELVQLCARATAETLRGIVEIYKAPAQLWSDVVKVDDGQKHLLQTVSLCGRKVTAWSRAVPRTSIERTACALGVSSTDVCLFAATEALRTFFEQAHNNPPEVVLATARAASEDFLFTFAEGDGKQYKKSQTGSMICISVPVGATPRRIASVLEQACRRQGALAGIWAAQAQCGALTRAVPSPLARLSLNILSRRYAVSYAEINSPVREAQRKTLWGQTVDSVIYWRPPQANISMSLTVVQYSGTVRLCVMTDARLSPYQSVPANRWPAVLEHLINKVDHQLARIAERSGVPQIITPENEDTEHSARTVPRQLTEGDVYNESTEPGRLRPPEPMTVSPPLRRRITHH